MTEPMYMGTMMGVDMGYDEPEIPKCKSCGQRHKPKFDFLGRCENRLKSLWENVRKLYWHRYSVSKVETK